MDDSIKKFATSLCKVKLVKVVENLEIIHELTREGVSTNV